MIEELKVSAPGRICLFGEHQDYLRLPVITAAISLRLLIEGSRRDDSQVCINLPDLNSSESFFLQERIAYTKQKDYFRSVANVLQKHGHTFSSGFNCTVSSNIPVNAGASSSSALNVAWVGFLAQMSDQQSHLDHDQIARCAHEAEVLEFSEAGGMMDQYSAAYGGVISIDFFPEIAVEPLPVELKTFVLGDSGEPKDTQGILSRVKKGVFDVVKHLSEKHPEFSLHSATVESIRGFKGELTQEQFLLLQGTILNHEITREARRLLKTKLLDYERFGELLTKHQTVLREVQRISTVKIDGMIDAALRVGAYGAKINGSGGGGSMFAYAPEHPEQVAEAIERAGGKAYIVSVDQGLAIESVRTSS